ncbi:sal-like protein 4 [Saccopteryx bilineata]|uniref:sal-like protein 4 n=1 Tax=Saccopteryx bilineata TaxID=59482 RepID=UPI00338F88B0
MSRRKQARPKHLNLEKDQGEQQPQQLAPESADAALAGPAAGEQGAPTSPPGTGDGMNRDQVTAKRPRREETHICERCCGEFFSLPAFLEHKTNCTTHQPIFIMNNSEGPVPSEDFFRAMPSHQPHGASSKDSHREDGGSSPDMKEQPGVESPLYSKTKTTLPLTPQDLSYLPKVKVTNTNVILQALPGTKVAVNQRRADPMPAPLPTPVPSANNIPWVLEQIQDLQQQQLQQIQLTEYLRAQVNMWANHALQSGMMGADTLRTLGSHMPQQVSAALALLGQKAGSQGLSLDTLKQARLPHVNNSSTTSSVSSGLGSFTLKPDGSKVLPNCHPYALLPQSSDSLLFQSPFPTVALDPSQKGKPSPVDVKPKDEAARYRHTCKYCSKVFGTERSLQTHLRSHTGQRPFVCSICGHRFTTEGDLRVHFHQHLQEKANSQPFAKFHDKIAAGIDVPYSLSVPVPVGESSLSLGSRPVLVTETPSVGLPQNLSWGTNPKDLMGGPLASAPQPRPSLECEDGAIPSGMGPNHNSLRVGGFQERGALQSGSETLKLQQLVENIDKTTTDATECLICHRVLSCESSLKMHYRTHTRQRPFQCTVCDRVFSTKDNLETHFRSHQADTSIKTQHSCPICQEKFTNAVMLQQHIRMHMDGQIPTTPLLQNPCDPTGPELMMGGDSGSRSAIRHDDVVKSIDVHKVGSQDAPSSSLKVPMHLPSIHSASPMPGYTVMPPVNILGKVGPPPVAQQWQSSREDSSVQSGGLTKNLPSTVVGNQEYQNRGPEVRESAPFQALSPASSQADRIQYKSAAGGKMESAESSRAEMKGWGSLPSAFVRAQPNHVKLEVPSAFGPPTMFPSMTPLIVAQPGQQGKPPGCTWYGKNFSASALQIPERTYTGERPFMSNIYGGSFTTKGNLPVHYMVPGANHSAAYCGNAMAIENPMALLGPDGKRLPVRFPQEITAPSVNVNPVVWNQYTTMLNGRVPMKTNQISVIQRVGFPTLPGSLGASSVLSNTTVSPDQAIDGSRSGISADVEKLGAADDIPKHRCPHFLET